MRERFVWIILILVALLAFEVFNFSTTQYALIDILGGVSFAGLRWATILAFVFCGIDFAGIARIFTPETAGHEPASVWYLFGAWFLAAAFNATLTWWAVGIAMIASGYTIGIFPVLVAGAVFLIRLLLIATFSVAGDRIFHPKG